MFKRTFKIFDTIVSPKLPSGLLEPLGLLSLRHLPLRLPLGRGLRIVGHTS
jgi:hypothetical protein